MTLSNGGLTVVAANAGYQSIRGTISRSAGKYYVEFKTSAATVNNMLWGLATSSFVISNYLGTSDVSIGFCINGVGAFGSPASGFSMNNIVTSAAAVNDVWAIAVDLTAGKIWVAQNNVWFTGNPAIGTNSMVDIISSALGQAYFPALSLQNGTNTGVWTLQSTAASQKYAPPAGFSAWDSAAPTNSPQALAYLARTVGGNEGGNGANIATLIDGLVADGVWAKLDALYVLAQQNETDAKLNLIGTSYGLTQTGGLLAKPGPRTGSLIFTAYVGFRGFSAVGSYFDTGFNPSSASSPKYTQNFASFGVWSGLLNDEAASSMGTGSLANMFTNYGATFYPRVNGGVSAPTSITSGLSAGDRPDAGHVACYQNGATGGPLAGGSGPPDNANFWVGGTAAGQGFTSNTLLRRLHRRFAWRGGATGALQSPSHVHDRDWCALMTAFSDFKAAISEWENRADWSDVLVTSFVRMAEAKFNAELRIDRMLSANDALIASRCAPLPDDWLELDMVRIATAPSAYYPSGFAPIVYKPRAEFFATQDEKAVGLYTIEGRQIFVGGLPNTTDGQTLRIDYYAEVPVFSDTQDSWVNDKYPAMYLSAARMHAKLHAVGEEEAAAGMKQLTEDAIQKLNAAHRYSRASGSRLSRTRTRSFG